ncbi:MAG: hypothetical protein SFV21_09245 [Rhodospirillaceae bacterium]|nr:hypothetical protein [Rhodospirillaceae bacterium]
MTAFGVAAGVASATPITRQTVFGDPPGLEYVPPEQLPDRTANSEEFDVAARSVLSEAANTATVPAQGARAPIPPAGVQERPNRQARSGAPPQTQPRSAVPRTVIPGVNEGMSTRRSDVPLVTARDTEGFGDLRLMDEADDLALMSRQEAALDKSTAAEVVGDREQQAAVVKEAVKSSREIQSDESVQSEIKAVLDENAVLVEFELVEIGEMDEIGDNGDGVLGMVRVIKAGGDDEFVINEDGQMVVTEKGQAENQIMRWSATDVRIDPSKASSEMISPEAFAALTEASLAMVGRLGSSPGENSGAVSGPANIFAQGVQGYAGLLDPSVLANQSDGDGKPQRAAEMSFAQFMAMLRRLLFQTQTIVVMIGAFVLSFVLYRFARRRG